MLKAKARARARLPKQSQSPRQRVAVVVELRLGVYFSPFFSLTWCPNEPPKKEALGKASLEGGFSQKIMKIGTGEKEGIRGVELA